jgi:hypothetical protein
MDEAVCEINGRTIESAGLLGLAPERLRTDLVDWWGHREPKINGPGWRASPLPLLSLTAYALSSEKGIWMPRRAALGLLLAIAVPAFAAEPEPSAARYSFVPVAAGALRLDTETGEVSLCVAGAKAPSCTRVSENVRLTVGERAKLEAEIAALETRVAALEAREQAGGIADEIPMGRVRILAARMFDHFVGAVRAVKHDIEGDEL